MSRAFAEEAPAELGHRGVGRRPCVASRFWNIKHFATMTYSKASDLAGLPRKCTYLPMQNREKILPSRSSAVTSPVISPSRWPASRSSSANRSSCALP